MAKRQAAGDLFKRPVPPREEVVRCNNAMDRWHRWVPARPAVLAPVIVAVMS